MNKTRIRYDCPPEIREAVEPYVNKLFPIVPGWVASLRIVYEGHPTSAAAMEANYKYRWANLSIYPSFLILNEVSRFNSVLHEFIHILKTPLQDFVEEMIEQRPEAERPRLTTEFVYLDEQFTQDAADGFHRWMEAIRDLSVRSGSHAPGGNVQAHLNSAGVGDPAS